MTATDTDTGLPRAVRLLLATMALVIATTAIAAAAPSAEAMTMRAIGDSFTSGFGYFGDGTEMGATQLFSCKPTDRLNDRCSSNSSLGAGSEDSVTYSSDYGRQNKVSYAAQVAHQWDLSAPNEYKNLAVTGSTAQDWATGQLNGTLKQVVADNPDVTLLTLGGNPTLSKIVSPSLMPICATQRDTDQNLIKCVQKMLDEVDTVGNLEKVYTELLQAPNNHVFVSAYPLVIPMTVANTFTVHEFEVMGAVLNSAVERAIYNVWAKDDTASKRLQIVYPPRFNTGVSKGSFQCGKQYNSSVDGPSHQSSGTQVQLQIFRPLDFCGSNAQSLVGGVWKDVDARPWILTTDTGIHPNRFGYEQMAAAIAGKLKVTPGLPAPKPTKCPRGPNNIPGCEFPGGGSM